MLHATLDRCFDQRSRVHGIVAVIAERIAQRIRHHDRSGEMDDGANFVIADDRRHQVLITRIADGQRYGLRQHGDIYHFHDPGLLPASLLLRLFGKKVIYDVHEDVPRDILLKTWIPALIRGLVAKAAARARERVAR